MKSYLEHVAVPVTDLEWSVRFYAEAFGMEETRRREEAGVPRQVWLAGGLQLVEAAAGAAGSETGWSHHLGLVVEDLAAALAPLGGKAQSFGDLDALVAAVAAEAQPGDQVLVMSNGGFGGVHGKLLAALA